MWTPLWRTCWRRSVRPGPGLRSPSRRPRPSSSRKLVKLSRLDFVELKVTQVSGEFRGSAWALSSATGSVPWHRHRRHFLSSSLFWPPSYTSSPAAPWQCGAAWPPAVQHQHHQPGELPVQVLPPRLPGLVHHPSPGSENAGLNGGERSHQPGPPAAPGGSASP